LTSKKRKQLFHFAAPQRSYLQKNKVKRRDKEYIETHCSSQIIGNYWSSSILRSRKENITFYVRSITIC
jgi:hypothetical protein